MAGIDRGVVHSIADSERRFADRPQNAQDLPRPPGRCRSAWRAASKGSRRRRKLAFELERTKNRAAEIVKCWNNWIACAYAAAFDLIASESLQHSNMVRSAKGTAEQTGGGKSAVFIAQVGAVRCAARPHRPPALDGHRRAGRRSAPS